MIKQVPTDVKNYIFTEGTEYSKASKRVTGVDIDGSDKYDGLFSSGTHYIFLENILHNIANEICRILKLGVYIALEWAIKILKKVFFNFEIRFIEGKKIYEYV